MLHGASGNVTSKAVSETLWTTPRLIVLLAMGVALGLVMMPVPVGIDVGAMRGGALVLVTIALFATGVLPEAITALAFFALAMLLAVAPPAVVFAGFTSTAFWLVFSGLVIGVAVDRTGLGVRLADAVIRRLGSDYARLVAGMIAVGVLLAFVMPSTMGRIMLLIPIVTALADRIGFAPGSRGRTGLVLAMACGTWMPSAAILPANVPNMVLAGVAETLFDTHFTYGSYFLLHFPATGLAKALLIYALVMALFRDTPNTQIPVNPKQEPTAGGPVRLLSVILFCTLGLWATDFLHGISPAWIALGAAVICLMPFTGLVPFKDFQTRVNFASAIYIAGILSIGPVLVETGAGDVLGRAILSLVPFETGADFRNFMVLTGLGAITGMATTAPGVPAVLGPLVGELSTVTGFSIPTVLMNQVIGYSTVILPYQVPPLILAIQLGGISLRDGARMTLAIAAVTLVVLTPLNYFWWQWLGYLN